MKLLHLLSDMTVMSNRISLNFSDAYKCIFVLRRSEKSVLWFFGESAWSLQLPGYPRLCRNSQLPWPDASRRALFPETFLRGGSAWGVHAAQPDRSWEAYKMWWNSGMKTGCHELLSVVLQRLFDLNIIDNWICFLKYNYDPAPWYICVCTCRNCNS